MIQRKYLAHFINATPGAETPTYCRLGADLEELNTELNPEVETKKNILGAMSVKVSSYEAQSSVEPYYADEKDPMYDFLQDIIDNRKVLDDCKTDAVEVHLWEETTADSGTFKAFKESCIIEISSYGGDTTGYQIPYNIHYVGDRVEGVFDPKTKTFTPSA